MRPPVIAFLVAGALTAGLVWLSLSLGPSPPLAWTVTKRTSAHRALVVEVEALHPEDALDIARQLSEPDQPRFDEILVFFHRPGNQLMLRRVQWTREHGYVVDVYGDEGRKERAKERKAR